MLTLTQIIERTRDLINAPGQQLLNDAVIRRHINTGMRRLFREARRANVGWFTHRLPAFYAFADFEQDASDLRVRRVEWPVWRIGALLELVRSDIQPRRIIPQAGQPGTFESTRRFELDRDFDVDSNLTHEVLGPILEIYGTMDPSSVYDIYHERSPAKLSQMKLRAAGAYSVVSGNGVIVLELTDAENSEMERQQGAYEDVWLVPQNAAGAQTPSRVINYAIAGTEATLTLKGENDAFNNDGMLVEMIPQMSAELHDILPLYAAMSIASSRANAKHLALLEKEAIKDLQTLTSHLEMRGDSVRHVYLTE